MDKFLNELRGCGENLKNSILSSVVLYKATGEVVIDVVTDNAFTKEGYVAAESVAKKYVPEEFTLKLKIRKLSPDCQMVQDKILEILAEKYKALSAVIERGDVKVEKVENGFNFTLYLMRSVGDGQDAVTGITQALKKCFCGEFNGFSAVSNKTADDFEVEEEHENIEYIIPIRTFDIVDFTSIESSEIPKTAIYLSDLNFVSEHVVICGELVDIEEREYTRKKDGEKKPYYALTINDKTATVRTTYFPRMKSIEKIKQLKAGDGIVCTGATEIFNGAVRFTAKFIDYGKQREDFVPEKRQSKPCPKYYSVIKPEKYEDFTQADLFSNTSVPDCLKQNEFVVFDLETTGLNSSPAGGNMDKIIEIGAYKIKNGVIAESFTTFINPQKKLSDEIIKLTGITEEMVKDAPTYEKVMPDFFKFCNGCYLVGHNIAGFDFKFVDYYCSQCGYNLDRKLFDTIPLSQQLLFLPNYKLNTVADHFNITFNHHRAIDDALVTAKIFIELVKIKKSLPNLC